MLRTLNLGILAHVDAGKTTLTERLLYAAGVIDEIGSVDKGNTQTDSLALERQRGITIKSAVVSFVVGDVTVNLIDTPGHPDFIAEVERVLNVLDGAVLVISAVEGVQPQTRIIMRTLQRLRIPTLLFVNKIDRVGARTDGVIDAMAERLTPAIIAMGSATGLGSRTAQATAFGPDNTRFVAHLTDVLAEHNDALLSAYLDDDATVSYGELRDELAQQTKRAQVHPVFFGSAITGAGVDALTAGITELLPSARGDVDRPVSGTVFKIERGRAGEKIAYVRIFDGEVRTRDVLRFGRGSESKVTSVRVFEDGTDVQRPAVVAGQIAKLWGLADVQIGHTIGETPTHDEHYFTPPSLETVVVPSRPSEKGALHAALEQLAEQDPLINLRQDDVRQELFVSLYGEVQKEVIQATLTDDFGIEALFRETTTICIERPSGTGEAVEMKFSASNPFPLGGVGLRVEPAPVASGIRYRRAGPVLGTILPAFFRAIEDTVNGTLRQGIYGWQVTDCTVTLTYSAYTARHSHAHQKFNKSMSSTAGDFRGLVPLVLMSALKDAGTCVYEPIHRFRLDVPADAVGPLLPALTNLGAVPGTPVMHGTLGTIEGDIPAARVYALQQQVPALTRGEGVLEAAFDHYEPVRGPVPTRPRTDHNPLDRKEYLLHVLRRV
jgi:ribosomal protection tetracycline resistance protein